jgi:hypothetical protein
MGSRINHEEVGNRTIYCSESRKESKNGCELGMSAGQKLGVHAQQSMLKLLSGSRRVINSETDLLSFMRIK